MMNKNSRLTKVYPELAQQVFRYAFSRLGNKEQAEDITSQTFVKLLADQNLDQVENIHAWAITIARNLMINQFKSLSWKVTVTSETIDVDETNYNLVPSQQLETEVIEGELVLQIKMALMNLTIDVREVIELKVWEEFTFAEIAQIQSTSESNVKFKYYTGIDKLKELLNEDSKNQKQMRAITIPILLMGLKQLGHNPEYVITASAMNQINNLFNNLTNMQKLISKLQEVRPIFWVLLLTALVVLSTVIGVELVSRNNNGAGTTGTTPTSAAKTKVDEYITRFDLAYIEAGEVYLRNYAGNDKLKLTDTNGKVASMLVSPDNKSIVYTISEPDLIQPKIDEIKSRMPKLKAELRAQYNLPAEANDNDVSYLGMPASLPTRAYRLDINTGKSELVIDYRDMAPDMDFLTRNFMAAIIPNFWGDQGITLLSFNAQNSDELIYTRNGVWMLNMATGKQEKIKESVERAQNTGAMGIFKAEWNGEYMKFDVNHYEWMTFDAYKLVGGKLVEVSSLKEHLGISIGRYSLVSQIMGDSLTSIVQDLDSYSYAPEKAKLVVGDLANDKVEVVDLDREINVYDVSINSEVSTIDQGVVYFVGLEGGSRTQSASKIAIYTSDLKGKTTEVVDITSYLKGKKYLITGIKKHNEDFMLTLVDGEGLSQKWLSINVKEAKISELAVFKLDAQEYEWSVVRNFFSLYGAN